MKELGIQRPPGHGNCFGRYVIKDWFCKAVAFLLGLLNRKDSYFKYVLLVSIWMSLLWEDEFQPKI